MRYGDAMDFNDRQYMIFAVTELDTIDFSEVLETSAETVRRSVDGTRTFVKWNGEMPACVAALTTAEGPYTHAEMVALLASPEWTKPMETYGNLS